VTSGPARDLLDGLAAAGRALADGDPVAASAALDVVVAACATLEHQGVRLDAATLREAMQLQQACEQAGAALSRELGAELQSAGVARRAASAYAR
jgi:hypothetical protein